MSNDNKTLADVQPGGRVRLGDQALRVFSAGRWTYDGTGQAFSHEEMDAAAFVVYRDAALSAQPSPGGQGDWRAMLSQFGEDDPREGSRSNGHDGVDHNDWVDHAEVPVDVLARIAAALAARQPVGPKFYTEDGPCWWHDGKAFIFTVDGDTLQLSVMTGVHCEFIGDARPFRVPAQAVDLTNVIEQIAQQWDGCSYDAVGETIDVGQAIRAAGMRLAMADSQAVGK